MSAAVSGSIRSGSPAGSASTSKRPKGLRAREGHSSNQVTPFFGFGFAALRLWRLNSRANQLVRQNLFGHAHVAVLFGDGGVILCITLCKFCMEFASNHAQDTGRFHKIDLLAHLRIAKHICAPPCRPLQPCPLPGRRQVIESPVSKAQSSPFLRGGSSVLLKSGFNFRSFG